MTTRELDATVLLIVELLGVQDEDLSWVVEKLLRIGAVKGKVEARNAAPLLGMADRTAARRLNAAGLPSPRALIEWGRMIPPLAAYRDSRSIEAAALSCGYSQSALSSAVRRHASIWPKDWKTAGGDMTIFAGALVAQHRVRSAA